MIHAIGYVIVASVFYLVGKLGRDDTSDVYDRGYEDGWDERDGSDGEGL